MPKKAPQRKANDIIEALNEIGSAEQGNSFILNRYKREAEKLKTGGQVSEAFIILGMIACLEDDVEAMHSCHKNAIHYSPTSIIANRNYAVSLLKTGFIEEAYKHFVTAYNISPTDKHLLNDVIQTLHDLSAIGTCHESDFDYYAERWVHLTREQHPLYDDPQNTAEVFDACDAIVSDDPDLVTEVDPDSWELAHSLIQGVNLDG